jgi:hypothetical protein
MAFAPSGDMRRIEPTRWDDLALAVLLLIIGVPRALLALMEHRPVDAEGATSMICVLLALAILVHRNSRVEPQGRTPGER